MLRLAGRGSEDRARCAAICGAVCVLACTLAVQLLSGPIQAQALASAPGTPMVTDPLPPQIHNLRFRRFALNDGLSQSTVNCIAQDGPGFMWFSTQDGLDRYDGYTFKIYQHKPDDPASLSHNHVTACALDKRDVLWVLTRDHVLHRYDPRTDRFRRYTLNLDNPLGQSLFSRLFDRQGRVWVGSDVIPTLYEDRADAAGSTRGT